MKTITIILLTLFCSNVFGQVRIFSRLKPIDNIEVFTIDTITLDTISSRLNFKPIRKKDLGLTRDSLAITHFRFFTGEPMLIGENVGIRRKVEKRNN